MAYKADRLLNAKPRAWEIDFLRGLAIVLMVFDHFTYDLSILPFMFTNAYAMPDFMYELYEFGDAFYWGNFRLVWHYVFATAFLLITGISSTFTRSNTLRGVRLGVFALLLSFATALIDVYLNLGAFILFGAIHCMAVAVLIIALLEKLPKSEWWMLFIGTAIILYGIFNEWYAAQAIFTLPDDTGAAVRTAIEIIIGNYIFGADHFPIFPCVGVVLVGAYIGKKFYASKRSLIPKLDGSWNKGFAAVGKRTVWIYLLHQPVVYGLLVLLGMAFGLEVF